MVSALAVAGNAQHSGWGGAKLLRGTGAWPRHPGHPRHPGRRMDGAPRLRLACRLAVLRACDWRVDWQCFAPGTCHVLGVLGVLGVLAARWPMKSLAGTPATGMWHPLRAGRQLASGNPTVRWPPATFLKNFPPTPCARSADLVFLRRQQTGRALARSATTSCCLGDERKKE